MEPRPIPHSWLDPRVEIRPSPISGRGLFAQEPIAAGEIVAVWGGIRITDDELAQVAATMPRYNAAAIGEGVNLLLALDDPIGFGNHSCDPNLWMRDAITIETRRAIARDEELTIDYATHTVTPQWQLESACRCDSPLCRSSITGNDWQRPELQERYRGHFSPFINDRIARLAQKRERAPSDNPRPPTFRNPMLGGDDVVPNNADCYSEPMNDANQQRDSRFILSICGPSGAGKSQLAKALVGLLGEAICARVPTDYYLLPATGPLESYLRQPVQYDWSLLDRDLSAPDGLVLTTPDFDFDSFVRRAERGGRPFRASPVMVLDGMYPYPSADAAIVLQVPSPIRRARIRARDQGWGTDVAARWEQLEQSRAYLETLPVVYDLALPGTDDPGTNAAAIVALIADKRGIGRHKILA